ncbi:hypothetical protein JCM5350_006164 [Sporobolomyces pararoseus]
MGFVSTFCPVSGCSPIVADALKDDFRVEEALDQLRDEGVVDTAIVVEAIEQLKSEQGGKASQLTVIGIITNEGMPVFDEESPEGDELLKSHSDDFRIVTQCEAAGMFEFGSVENPALSQSYLVSYGACIMILSSALPLLYLATDCRMTSRRIWQLCMKLGGHNVPQNHYVLPGIDYGEVEEAIDQFLLPLPKWSLGDSTMTEKLRKLGEEGRTVEEAKKALIHQGGYWVWMSPDNQFDQLPFDVLSYLASFLPLVSLLSLASTNRALRQTLLGSPSSRSQTMRKWLLNEGRYWLPQEIDLGIPKPKVGAVPRVDELAKPTLKELELGDADDDWWSYVSRCIKSGSMRNRRRIWSVAMQLEEKANELGV